MPSAQERPVELEPVDRSLTVREELLFRAATRRTLRAATELAGITVAGLTALNALGMTLLFPERQAQVLAINGIEGVVGLSVTVPSGAGGCRRSRSQPRLPFRPSSRCSTCSCSSQRAGPRR